MESKPAHCPFLNRADSRCSRSFRLDRLDHAFVYCFGRYKSCPTYLELLVERRLRRSLTGQNDDGEAESLVQLNIAIRDRSDAKPDSAAIPALFGR